MSDVVNILLVLKGSKKDQLGKYKNNRGLDIDQDNLLEDILSHPDVNHAGFNSSFKVGAGMLEWFTYSIYIHIDSDRLQKLLDWVESKPSDAKICGSWNMDGSKYKGSNGKVKHKTISGLLAGFVPNKVVYNTDGDETSNTVATEPEQVNLLAGQKPREF